MANRKSILLSSLLSVLLFAGCFFGGENDSPTGVPGPATKPPDPPSPIRWIAAGAYAGDYSGIESNVYQLESEFVLDPGGDFDLLWIVGNETVIHQRGRWSQRDSSFFFESMTETWPADDSLFVFPDELENDTNAVRDVTDSSFVRLEWTPLRQKPYWIPYRKMAIPVLKNGRYVLSKVYPDTSGGIESAISMEIGGGAFSIGIASDTLETFQSTGNWRRVGSFLAMEEVVERTLDSVGKPTDWNPVPGYRLKRLSSVSDTAFSLWSPSSPRERVGYWDRYRLVPP